MSLKTMRAEVVQGAGPAIQGYTWPVAAFAYEELIASAYPDNIVSYASPGRIKRSDAPVADADAASTARLWTGQAAGLTRPVAADVLGGLPRWSGADDAGQYVAANLAAQLTSYSVAVLFKSTSLTGHNGLFGVGDDSNTRALIYQRTTGDIAVQHGIGDGHNSTGVFAADAWHALVWSYDDATGAGQLCVNSIDAPDMFTMTASPPADLNAAIMADAGGGTRMDGEVALVVVWDRALHIDGGALGHVMDGLNGLKSL